LKEGPYDFVIVGAGIAGLAIAELFSRSGLKVALLEKNPRICQEASGEHHGWFHFGSLYSIFPNNQFMRTLVGGIDDLLAYYSHYPAMNVRVGSDGRLGFPQGPEMWVRDEPIEYIVSARNDPDFNLRTFDGISDYSKKLFFLATWEFAIKQFISRHQRFHKFDWRKGQASQWVPQAGWLDYSREVISKPRNTDVHLDIDTHFRIIGFDRPMNTTAIVSDLLRSFLATGGTLSVNTEVASLGSAKGEHTEVVTNQGIFRAKKVILSAGKWLEQLLGKRIKLKVVASPLLAVYPRVCQSNFVRLTPFVDKSVNHLLHAVNGLNYSLIGGGYFADPNDSQAVKRAEQNLISMARRIFPQIANTQIQQTYIGYKTEVATDRGERNYQYLIRSIDDSISVVIPGKFSLGFSLAVNAYKRLVGGEPEVKLRCVESMDVSEYVGMMRHAEIVSNAMREGVDDASR
jgi:glycine/D-amino acid oxidase-like deaminating enzyme